MRRSFLRFLTRLNSRPTPLKTILVAILPTATCGAAGRPLIAFLMMVLVTASVATFLVTRFTTSVATRFLISRFAASFHPMVDDALQRPQIAIKAPTEDTMSLTAILMASPSPTSTSHPRSFATCGRKAASPPRIPRDCHQDLIPVIGVSFLFQTSDLKMHGVFPPQPKCRKPAMLFHNVEKRFIFRLAELRPRAGPTQSIALRVYVNGYPVGVH